MNLIMKDYVTSAQRMDFSNHFMVCEVDRECVGCGRTSTEIRVEDQCTQDQLDDYSVTTDSGLWYCHSDCYRDSR